MEIVSINNDNAMKILEVEKEKESIEELVIDTNTKTFNISPACSDLITSIDSSFASLPKIRTVIKEASNIKDYDLIEHQDLNFEDMRSIHLKIRRTLCNI